MRMYLSQFAGAALIDVTLKALLAVALAGLFAAVLRKTTGSTRHAIWLTATVMLVTLPIAGVALPQLSLPLLPAEPVAATTEVEAVPLDIQLRQLSRASPQAAPDAPIENALVAAAPAPGVAPWSWSTAAMVVWGAGGVLVIVRVGVGFVRLNHLRRSGEEVNDSAWRRNVEQVKRQTGVHRDVRLLKSPCADVPMTWGLWRIYVCLPSHADEWSATNCRMVLTHELTHVRRGDLLWQLLAIAMTAAHWFNPLAWWAAHRLRMEAETACDDAVIACGSKPSDYAACLCQMVRAARAAPLRLSPTLSMARPSELPRRLAMILNDNTKHDGTHFRTLVLTLIASAVLGSIFGAAQVGRAQAANDATITVAETKGQKDQALEHINASPMEKAGVYHISPVFKKLVKVTVIKRGGPYGPDHKRPLEGWNYDKKTGRLTVKETVDNEKEMVVVYGKRKVPWAWQMQGPISDVKILIGKEAAVRGEDYEVDEVAGTVRFRKKEHCREGVHYHISYGYRDEPSKSGSIGNHPDRALVRKFLGLHPTQRKEADIGKSIGTNASRTDNPKVWTMMRSMRSDSIRVGLGRRSVKGELDWLKRGKDFSYDETLATITLLREIPLEEDSWIFVSGVPTQRGRFLYHSELTKGEVKVILGDRLLEEGVGYEVDYKQGVVTIVDKAIEKKGAKYFISAGGRSMGNHSNTALVQKLLGTTERVYGKRPRGNCSISGKVISAETGKPIENARMYLFDNKTFGSMFIRTAAEGTFKFKDIPTGPFSLQSSHTAGYQDVGYNPEGKPGYQFIPFSLKDGEQRSGIVLKAKRAYQISGKIVDENGKIPEDIESLSVMAWVERNDGKGYRSKQAIVKRADGSYSIDGLGDKPVYVMARDWRAAKKADPYPPIYYPSTFSRNDAKQITFGEKRLVDNINITLRREGGFVLEGTVTDRETGAPIPKALITVHHVDMLFDRVTAYTDEKGVYRVRGLGPGELAVHVDASPWRYVRTRKVVTLDDAKKTKSMDVTVRAGVSIRGKFVDQHGKDMDIYENAYGLAFTEGYPTPESNSWSGADSRYSPTDVFDRGRVTFNPDEGDYEEQYMIFPTKRSFVIPAMTPGKKKLRFHPKNAGLSVIQILRDGEDISQTGIELIAGKEVKNVVIMIGPSQEKADAEAP